MTLVLALLGALHGLGAAGPMLWVRFAQPAGVHVSARTPSTLVLSSGPYTRQFLLGGPSDPRDPEGNIGQLDNVNTRLPLTAGARLAVKARLYVCDARRGLCRVDEQTATVRLGRGLNRLTLTVGAGR